MKSNLYSRWLKEMKRQGFFHAGQRIGVAVSGGPDSVLLLHFMRDSALEWGITLAVVHFNHHLRGAESDADERFV
ncbi:MAG TPA: ATP-binding protein, partial [Terriglobia bacterium]|nr:ATP-binding protein [Terriglobia bacterium]